MQDLNIKDIPLEFREEIVLQMVECKKENELYDEFAQEARECYELYHHLLRPHIVTHFEEINLKEIDDNLSGVEKVVFSTITVGDAFSKLSTKYFETGDFVKGMLADAIADDALFQADSFMQEQLKTQCVIQGYGVKTRLEPPNEVPIEVQRYIYNKTNAAALTEISILESCMLNPVKSMCIVYILKSNCDEFHMSHDCKKCHSYTCALRNLQKKSLKVFDGTTTKEYVYEVGISLLESLKRHKIYVPAMCNGNGTCGKCSVRFMDGVTEITAADEQVFTESELQRGMRLSCRSFPSKDCLVEVLASEQDIEVLSDYKVQEDALYISDVTRVGGCAVAIDIGTTTIAMQCIEKSTKCVVDTNVGINMQRAYGGDVISRIKASNDGNKDVLQESIHQDLSKGIEKFLDKGYEIEDIYISGNTTMIHLFMAYSCEKLGVFPFIPETVEAIQTTMVLKEKLVLPVHIMPGISAFVGADIVAGMLACDMDQSDKVSVLIDLGTNGEMAIGNKKRMIVTSTAAGPAFEGGNISRGCASIGGAIHAIALEGRNVAKLETIYEKEPIGICGTGVVDITSELLRVELIDETGRLDDDYFDDGFVLYKSKEDSIVFTQKDIREIQLAKSAIRAGLEVLILEFGVTYEDIDKVYLAGGFGCKMDIKKGVFLGMFPEELEDKMEAIGNSALEGCILYAMDENARNRADAIEKTAKEVNLSETKQFNDLYMEYMFFE